MGDVQPGMIVGRKRHSCDSHIRVPPETGRESQEWRESGRPSRASYGGQAEMSTSRHGQNSICMKKTKKTQIDINHNQEGIGHRHKRAGPDEGEQRDGEWRRDKKAEDTE